MSVCTLTMVILFKARRAGGPKAQGHPRFSNGAEGPTGLRQPAAACSRGTKSDNLAALGQNPGCGPAVQRAPARDISKAWLDTLRHNQPTKANSSGPALPAQLLAPLETVQKQHGDVLSY